MKAFFIEFRIFIAERLLMLAFDITSSKDYDGILMKVKILEYFEREIKAK